MERSIRKIGVVNFLMLLAATVLSLGLGRYAHSFAGQVAAVFFGAGTLVAMVAIFQMGLEEKERLEKLEFDELTRDKASASLFAAGEAEAFPARHAREQFEKWILPIFTVVLVVGIGVSVVMLWSWLKAPTVEPIIQPMVAAALFGVQALILFVLGKYSANLARLDGQRLVRPASSFQVFGAYLSMAIAVCIGLVYGGQPRADLWMARVVIAVLAIITIEGVVSLILEIYRPRVKGKQVRLIYESRLIGLMGQPEGIFSTAATALDYQFGFKVSETWFYRFLQRAIVWLVLVQLGVLVLSSTVVFIEPGEQGLIERWGQPRAEHILNPGAHLKFPWPMEKVYRFGTDQIQTFTVGMVAETNNTANAVLWTVKHAKEEFNLLVASRDQGAGSSTNKGSVPADLLSVSIPVQYQIRNVNDFAYKHVDGGKLLEEIATREVVRYLVGVDIFDIMSAGRNKASNDLQKLIQEQADARELGVKILFVGLQDIHPPVKVAPSYELVVGTRQEMESNKRKAEGYAARTLALADAEAQKRIYDAEAYRAKKVAGAQAQAARYPHQLAGYLASPTVFTNRAYLEAWARGSTNARKYVLAVTNATESIQLNLEDRMREDLAEIPVPKPK
jgi:regulator of protease activity HflC (stomatin/prohibitin superfamily)